MSNIIQLDAPHRRQDGAERRAVLIGCFAGHRRFGDDVFWLKENAELLNILECTGARPDARALEPHLSFYDSIENRLGFFPQYYRFLLSICLDLEDLGIGGTKGEALAHWAAGEGLADAELSDLQRAEARRLMQRRGIDPLPDDTGLTDRLHAFIDRSETFAMPNKKAAYELTHILFYLSEYGRRDPGVSAAALRSLEYAGLLAYLEQNADLLAEICIALRYAGARPPAIWEGWVQRQLLGYSVRFDPQSGMQDDYHEFLVCNWLMSLTGREGFAARMRPGRLAFHRGQTGAGPLRQMSQAMFDLGDDRSDDWQVMRPRVQALMDETGREILAEAEDSTGCFDAFFAGFARTGLRGVAL